jgi:prepilin-type N-terminal cleavage/methylation domain-containing protein
MRKTSTHAFTLVEMLVAIVIIGAIAGIAVPAFLNIFRQGESAKTQRNAHTIVTTYAGARAAGATFTSASADVRGRVAELMEGKHGAGMMSDAVFRVDTLGTEEMNAVLKRLRYVEETDSLMIISASREVYGG